MSNPPADPLCYNRALAVTNMPKWPIDAKEFEVSVMRNVQRDTSYSYIPKPILAKLGDPKRLLFVIRGDKIIVTRRE